MNISNGSKNTVKTVKLLHGNLYTPGKQMLALLSYFISSCTLQTVEHFTVRSWRYEI